MLIIGLFFGGTINKISAQQVEITNNQISNEDEAYATCDLCGYCQGNRVPDNWKQCRDCIYPDLGEVDAEENQSLQIIDNIPITPKPGRIYTMLGCISSNMNSFEEEGSAAANVSQILLNIIFGIIGGIGFLYLIYGAFIILTSQANPERLNYGKRVVLGAIIGVIFSLFAVFIVNFIASGILKIPNFGGSNSSLEEQKGANSGFIGN